MYLFTNGANTNFKKHIRTQSKQALIEIDRLVDWAELVSPLISVLSRKKEHLSAAGRKPHDLIVIVKCMILQMLYGLSDPRLEEEIADRRSFQIFLGLTSGDSIPDETTICRYRKLFVELGLGELLFDRFTEQLSSYGFIVGKGTIVDATLKEAQAKPSSGRDRDAGFARRGEKVTYGYKGHIGVDANTNVIHSVSFTPANVHDTEEFEKLLLNTEEVVYGDKGYSSKKRKRELRYKGIHCAILDKGYRDTPLSPKQIKRNKRLSKIRSKVEQTFAFFKEVLQYRRCRYYDLARNRFQFILSAIAYNLRRMITLSRKFSMNTA
ncbi:MAG TPA: IS5 family transposase [Candidatus Hydrogenedens sp.]|nr:IS5 family transposase [Candidatus Hydrogenedens sp.]